MKKILVFVSGISPAIISETIYALAKQQPAWIADEIIVFTTTTGKDKIETNLINNNVLNELAQDLKIKITLPLKNILIPMVKGEYLSDIRNNGDNMEFANYMSQEMHKLTNNDNQLYVSMAGGRKTMGFYLAYTLSLYGREQDKLLHVLVNSPFETIPQFHYPKSYQYTCHDGSIVNFNDAKVDLAEIPFIRLRNTYSNENIKAGKFYQAVQEIEDALNNNNASLKLNPDNSTIECDGVKIKLTNFRLAIYSYIVKYYKENNAGCLLNSINLWKLKDEIEAIHNYSDGLIDEINDLKTKDALKPNGEFKLSSKERSRYIKNIRSEISRINKQIEKSLGIHSDKFKISAINNGLSD
ncbi:MAG: hypothetical protein RLZZ293_1317, partial [Pseudomonadota bacterium]